MKRRFLIGAMMLAAVAMAGSGCVSQAQYDDLNKLYRQSLNQVASLQSQLDEANNRIRLLEASAGRGVDPDMQARLDQALADKARLEAALAEAKEALRRASLSGPVLEPQLDAALRDLAAAHPELIEYDPALGMLKFRSDLTFDLGSVALKAEAGRGLGELAQILRTPVAEKYEARIVGHTDNVRIAREQTRALHPTNWHLSVHRAIAVKDALEKAGVQPVRLGVAGYGEYRPVVANGNRGAEANRRVEIYLVPNTYKGPGLAAPAPPRPDREPAPGPAPAAESGEDAAPPEMFK